MDTLAIIVVLVLPLGAIVYGIVWGLRGDSDSEAPKFIGDRVRPHVPGSGVRGRFRGSQYHNTTTCGHITPILDVSDSKNDCSSVGTDTNSCNTVGGGD